MKAKTAVIQAAKAYYTMFAQWADVKRNAVVKPVAPQVSWKPGSNAQCGWTVDDVHFGPVSAEHVITYYQEMAEDYRQRIERSSDPVKPRPAETSENDLPSPRPDEDR